MVDSNTIMAVNADPTKRLRPRTRLSMPGKTDETPSLVPSRPAAKAAESSPLNGATQSPHSAVAADRMRTGHAARDQQQAEEVHLCDRLASAKQAKAKLIEARRSKRQAMDGESIRQEEAPQQERTAKAPPPQPEKLRAYHDVLRSNSSSAALEMHKRAMQVEAQKNQREGRARQAAEEKERRAAAVLQQAEARKADMARVVAEERARRKAEEKAMREAAEEVARREAEEEAAEAAEEAARVEVEEVVRRTVEEVARREAEEAARKEAEEVARREAEERARQEEAQREAEEKARLEAEEAARREAQEAARREEEERVRLETEKRAQQEVLVEAAREEAREEARRLEAAEAAMLAGHEANRIGAHAFARRSFCEASALQPRPAALVSAANMARRTRIAS